MRGKLNDVSMKELDDPQELFIQLVLIEDQYNNNDAGIKVYKADLIAVALSVAPEKYQGVMATYQIHKGDTITLENLYTAMKTLFLTTKGKAASEENGGGEVALSGFNGNCHNYGEPGHPKF